MLRHVLTHPASTYTGVDPWLFTQPGTRTTPAEVDQRARRNLLRAGGRKVQMMKRRSAEVLPRLPAESVDVAYIDGDHTADAVLFDSVECWRLLRPGGLLIWDDYGGAHDRPRERRPATAIDAFLAGHAGLYELAWQGYQLAVRKIHSDHHRSGRVGAATVSETIVDATRPWRSLATHDGRTRCRASIYFQGRLVPKACRL